MVESVNVCVGLGGKVYPPQVGINQEFTLVNHSTISKEVFASLLLCLLRAGFFRLFLMIHSENAYVAQHLLLSVL